MKISRFIAPLLLLPLAAFGQEKPAQFAARWPIETREAAPYYRLSVPLAVYLASAHGDLRDLRVFNATGQALPYSRLSIVGGNEESVQRQGLPWFPLPAAAKATHDEASLSVRIRQAADGTLVEIKEQSGSSGTRNETPETAARRGYVLDASQVKDREAVRALELDWDKAGGDFQLLDLEASDDLQHWRPLAREVQLARLDYQGARIERRRIDLSGFHERYLRLLWREPAQAPQLARVEIERCSSRYRAAPLVWSAPISASTAGLKSGEYRFRLPQALPLASLRLELPPGNQLLPLEVRSAGQDHHGYRLANTVVYRIASHGREWSNTEISLDGSPLQEFVLKIDPRLNPLPQGPRLAFALHPEQIVFLASGTAPYTLAIGQRDARDAALPPGTLVPGFGQPGSPEIVSAGLVASAIPPASPDIVQNPVIPAEQDWKKIALWAVLVLGVLGMAAMAWQLLRQMKAPERKD